MNKEDHNEFIYKTTQKMITQIVNTQDQETIKAIKRYCEENNIIPNLIDEDKLKLVLKLGIDELNKRELKEEV